MGALSLPERPGQVRFYSQDSALPITPAPRTDAAGSGSLPSKCAHRCRRCGERTFEQGVHLKPKS